MSEALESCPFCGSEDVGDIEDHPSCVRFISCNDCTGAASIIDWNTRTALQCPTVDVELLRQGVKAVVESLEYYASDEHTDEYSNLETLHNNMPKQNKAIRDFIKGDHLASQGYLRNPLPKIEGLGEVIAQHESDSSLLLKYEIDLLAQAAKSYLKESEGL